MDKKIIKFGDTKIDEYEFHKNKSPISINNIDINKTVDKTKCMYFMIKDEKCLINI